MPVLHADDDYMIKIGNSSNYMFFVDGGKYVDSEVTIYDDGDVMIDPENGQPIILKAKDLEEIVRLCKIYRDRRTVYLNRKQNERR